MPLQSDTSQNGENLEGEIDSIIVTRYHIRLEYEPKLKRPLEISSLHLRLFYFVLITLIFLLVRPFSDVRCETPLDMAFLTSRNIKEKSFAPHQVDLDSYYREVRRALYSNMFGENEISLGQYVAFCRRWEREGGMFNKTNSSPKFEAWSLVRGTARNGFNYGRFFARYPTCRDQVYHLRKFLDINVKDNLH